MRSLTRLVPALALFAALPACDGDDKDMMQESSTGEAESGSSGSESGSSEGGSETEAAEAVCDAETHGSSRPCEGGTQFCFTNDAVAYEWGSCVASPACVPGVIDECESCVLDDHGVPTITDTCEDGTSTPLVLNFDGAPVEYGSA
ncbi:MAG TPA: hypothetical protein VGB85_03110, partial [Nannocystis sp.]